jgi:hypothetical protein
VAVTCLIDDCHKPPKGRGWCSAHYERWRKYGDPLATFLPPVELRWQSQVAIQAPGCWIWTGPVNVYGYGRFRVRDGRGLSEIAHRAVWQLIVGPIPNDLSLDHLCRVKRCVNPDHLEPVTHAENCRRGHSPGARARRDNRCKWGHEFTPENTLTDTRGHRICRTCNINNSRARRERLAGAAA